MHPNKKNNKELPVQSALKPLAAAVLLTCATDAAIADDVRTAGRWRDRLGYIFGPPGWEPQNSPPAAAVSVAGAGS